ncbi:hypothetical protein QCB44_09755 [Thiomicrorhabdus sp. zzn3]|uniref:hypothetical protein n=1 Tax=Thiomicrorhabdus sp. zzn3 TaxID=3039775 RepID=UPI0024370EE9|nr:hypothetical protein [Thiomicrorhabdus sp. zzn3]MDG6778993.1 hypothetical protein [Thiomicrorhabdus sp. zzn3]
MCVFIFGAILILLYTVNIRLERLELSQLLGNEKLVVAQGWEIVVELWPLALMMVLIGVLIMLVLIRVSRFDKSDSKE